MLSFSERNFQYPLNWKVKNYPVYRLLDNTKWIDNFFDSGEIQLSCFAKFRKYPNEIQGDPAEGSALCYFEDDERNTIGFQYESGLSSYILSTTEVLSDKIIEDFQAVGAIKILDTTNFALELSKKIAYCFSGLEGRCQYEKGRSFPLKDMKTIARLYKLKNGKYDDEFRSLLQSMVNEYELFLKTKKYEYQNEYRFTWHTSIELASSINIKCPEARSFCERIIFQPHLK